MDPDDAAPSSAIPEAAAPKTLGARRALATLAVYFGAQVVVGFVIVLVALFVMAVSSGGKMPTEQRGRLMKIAMMPSAIAGMLWGAHLAFRMARRSFPGALRSGAFDSLGWSKGSTGALAVSAVAGLALSIFFVMVVSTWFPPAPGRPVGPFAQMALTPGWTRYAWIVTVVCLAPPIEEFVFRGVLLTGLTHSWGPAASACVVTVSFVSLHMPEVRGYLPALVGISSLAVGALVVRLRFASLGPAVALHTAYNLGCVVALLSRAPH